MRERGSFRARLFAFGGFSHVCIPDASDYSPTIFCAGHSLFDGSLIVTDDQIFVGASLFIADSDKSRMLLIMPVPVHCVAVDTAASICGFRVIGAPAGSADLSLDV